MKALLNNCFSSNPRVSVVLLDWSVRESFHILDYLDRQTVPRSQYEILWIEYYDHAAPAIQSQLKMSQKAGGASFLNQWISLDIPRSTYYHKHLMYNVGLVKARGDIVVICDSDAMLRPTFIQSILETFESDPGIVLHLDEVRNVDRRFYRFNYPSFEDVLGPGCINWKDGKTTGLLDRDDILHTRNYGACFCARRRDLIAIGGADEHRDYLGHICGPYEMTFRLVNAGRREVWHESEFLFHTWHPGTDGLDNYLGPHDGYNMSATALAIRANGRIGPLVENAAIRRLREGDVAYNDATECLMPVLELHRWGKDRLIQRRSWKAFLKNLYRSREYRQSVWSLIRWTLDRWGLQWRLLIRQLRLKTRRHTPSPLVRRSLWEKFQLAFVFGRRMFQNHRYTLQSCRQVLQELVEKNVARLVIFGQGPLVSILKTLLRDTPIRLQGVYADASIGPPAGFQGPILVASLTNVSEQVATLEESGIPRDNIVTLT